MSPLHHCVNEGKLESLRFLLEKGVDPNVRDLDGVACINLAKSSHGMSEFVELLLKYGADPTIKDKHTKKLSDVIGFKKRIQLTSRKGTKA